MPSTGPDWRRRAYLTALGGAVAGLAGCPSDDSAEPTATTTETTPTDAVETPIDTTTTTETPTTLTFDGDGASAFADALQTLRSSPVEELHLPPGTYRFDASAAPAYEYPREDDRVHFDGTGLDGVTIAGPPPDADGTAEVVLEDPTRGFLSFGNPAGATAAGRPTGATVRDLTVRHDPLPYTQGEITALSGDRRELTLTLESGFPTVDEPPFVDPEPLLVSASVFTAAGDRIRRVTEAARSNFKRFASIEALDGRRARLRLADGVEPGGLALGRRLVLLPRHRNATQFIHRDVTEPTYERVAVHSAANFAFQFDACDRPVVRDCRLVPPPNGPGLVATNADGVHCNNCPRGPLVEGCTVRRTSDDAVAVDAELLAVQSFVDDRTVRVSADVGTRVGAGDVLMAATPTLTRKGTLPPVTEVDQRGGGVTTRAVNPELVRFSEPVRDRLGVGDALLGPRMHNAGTVVRDTTVREIRARFVRFGGVTGGHIEDNTFVGTNSDGIEIAASGDVREGFSDLKGWSSDVVVRGNEVVDVGLVGVPAGIPRGIFVGVEGEEGPPPAASVTGRPHRDIQLTDNRIRRTGGHGVEVGDAEGVRVEGVRVENSGRLTGPAVARYGLGIRNARAVTVRDTTVTTDDDLDGYAWTHDSGPVTTDGNAFVVAGQAREPTLVDLGEEH